MDGKTIVFWILACVEFYCIIWLLFPEVIAVKKNRAGVGSYKMAGSSKAADYKIRELQALTLILANVFAFLETQALVSDYTILFLPMAAAVVYRGFCGKRLWTAYIWILFWAVSGYLCKLAILILEEIFSRKKLELLKFGVRSWWEMIGEALIITGLIFMGKWVRKEGIKLQRLCGNSWPALLLICTAGYGTVRVVMPLYLTLTRILILLLDLCAMTAVAAVFWAVFVWNVNQHLKEEQALVDVRGQMLERFYQESHQQYREIARLNHDVKHERRFLEKCLEENRVEEARLYLAEKGKQTPASGRIWTGMSIVDFVINKEMGEMERKGIHFSMESGFERLPVAEGDFVVLLGNVLENAVEAAGKCEREERWIKADIRMKNDIFLFSMSNSSEELPKIREEEFLTTKDDKAIHGWGLKNVERIVKKYDGTIEFHYTDRIFKVTVIFWKGMKAENSV